MMGRRGKQGNAGWELLEKQHRWDAAMQGLFCTVLGSAGSCVSPSSLGWEGTACRHHMLILISSLPHRKCSTSEAPEAGRLKGSGYKIRVFPGWLVILQLVSCLVLQVKFQVSDLNE